MFIQRSTEYIQHIEGEIERLQQLRDQVQATIQSEEELQGEDPDWTQPGYGRSAQNSGQDYREVRLSKSAKDAMILPKP